jgi:hypothetical protein
MMQGTSGDPHDFGNGRLGNGFRQQILNVRFAAHEFRRPQDAFGTADLFAFRTCSSESLFGPFGNEVSLHLCEQTEQDHHDLGLDVRRLAELEILFNRD